MGGLALGLCYLVALRAPAVGLYHDDGIYLTTAKALAEGEGYRIISLPQEIPQTKYPVLFPAALAVVWKLFPDFPANVVLLKMVPFAAALIWFFLVYLVVKRETWNTSLAAGVVLLTAISPHVLFVATSLVSETLFAALAWGALILLRRYCERGFATKIDLLWVALLASAAFHTRTIGFTLIAAGVTVLAVRVGYRQALQFGILCALLVAPWIVWVLSQADSVPWVHAYYAGGSYGSGNVLFSFDWGQKFKIVGWNILYALIVPGWSIGLTSVWIAMALMPIGILAMYGLLSGARRNLNVNHLFVLFYLVVVLLWAWHPIRFLVPIYPFILLFAWDGVRRIVTSRNRRFVIQMMLVALALQAGFGFGRSVNWAAQNGVVCQWSACPTVWQDVDSLLAYLRRGTPADATIMTSMDPMIYLYTGRKSFRAYDVNPYLYYYSWVPDVDPFGPAEKLAKRILEGEADYLVNLPTNSRQEPILRRQVRELTHTYPGALRTIVVMHGMSYGVVYDVDAPALRARLDP